MKAPTRVSSAAEAARRTREEARAGGEHERRAGRTAAQKLKLESQAIAGLIVLRCQERIGARLLELVKGVSCLRDE